MLQHDTCAKNANSTYVSLKRKTISKGGIHPNFIIYEAIPNHLIQFDEASLFQRRRCSSRVLHVVSQSA